MGSQQSVQKCNFEDIQDLIRNKGVLINTLPDNDQSCLINGTIDSVSEIKRMNELIQTNKSIPIVIYGKNSNDTTVQHKYEQLLQLGFSNIFIYSGGLFEWLCLQDIYGSDEFPTTIKELDILKFKPCSNVYRNNLIMNS